MNYSNFCDQVYSQDFKRDGPNVYIQWKGTQACIDLYCSCGLHGHVHTEYSWFYECACGKKYALGETVKLIELNEEQIKCVESNRLRFLKNEPSLEDMLK